MKLPRSKFWEAVGLSFVFLLIILTISAVWFKRQLTSEELNFITHLLRQFIGPIVIITLLLLAVCSWAVEAVFRNYIRPIRKMAEKVSLINTSNPSYRIRGAGAGEIRELCEGFVPLGGFVDAIAKLADFACACACAPNPVGRI